MAVDDIEPAEQETIKKQLNSKLKYFFLAIIGIAIVVTVVLVFFGGSGGLFKGIMGGDPELPPEFPPLTFPPTVVSVSPVINAIDVSTEAGVVTVVFDEDGLAYDLSTDITILASASTDNKLSSPISYASKTLTINYSELEGDTQYTVTIPAGTIKNGTEPMDSVLSWSFTTEEAPPPEDDDDDDTDDTDADDDTDTDTDDDEEEEEIEITNHDVSPETFNPLINETKISYEISADAIIEIKIIDHTGVTILTLVDDEEVEEGDYYVWWNGTDRTDTGGEVVSPGTYTYKIYAKDPIDEEVQDIKSGEVSALYAQATEDFEDYATVTTPVTQPISAGTTAQDAAATVSLQNAQSGVTVGTGTPTLIYLLFPLGGIFLYRKKK